MSEHKGLPIAGYHAQSEEKIAVVNENKKVEEAILRLLDQYTASSEVDQRWLAIGRSHIEQGFMAINRAVFKPGRVQLDGDEA
ncbi:Acb2/Tad1 domain-containing protein [Shinella zoogloeoides]|uniref:Cyclic nucleotide-binding protein n=1 Tax=Shinella zoogloeoides TaxID=352475 RepID=A0A6N8TDZ6_SHIZO|nr:cyclic nucleotide-binding protein [Shinella zoogloeoides]MXN99437.1 cyclic nucleotide-binding protein [Shinella zoogloeoides]UEX82784.1 hypothetical protein K8M09_05760 [Shinella zoogloeoides]